MSLYKKCRELLTMDSAEWIAETNTDMPELVEINTTLPEIIWEHMDRLPYNAVKKVYYISDLHLIHHILPEKESGASDWELKRRIKKIARGLFKGEFMEDIAARRNPIVLFGGDIASSYMVATLFYAEFMAYWTKVEERHKEVRQEIGEVASSKRYVYAILGNHEFWDFSSVEECYTSYERFFESVGIHFLNNSMTWLGAYNVPSELVWKDDTFQIKELKREDDEIKYDREKRHTHNILIVGGVGFAGRNESYNANNGLYRLAIGREEEIANSEKWCEVYRQACVKADKTGSVLIVLTHNPVTDWNDSEKLTPGCVYFNGHTHYNRIYQNTERNEFIYADNQIGYHNKAIQLKSAYIFNRYNPFSGLKDGYTITSSEDYLRFYEFMCEKIQGNRIVEKQLETREAKFYVIKHEGCYGFFLVKPKISYICAGGHIKKIGRLSIEEIDAQFMNMVKTYLAIMSPYRNKQEKVSEYIRAFGGNGKIHGCIVDIDFFCHVLISPIDGKCSYYYSPIFGEVEYYNSMFQLLKQHNSELAAQVKRLEASSKVALEIINQTPTDVGDYGMQKVDIKHSLYAISTRLNQLQRLFDKKILRDWNEELILENIEFLES